MKIEHCASLQEARKSLYKLAKHDTEKTVLISNLPDRCYIHFNNDLDGANRLTSLAQTIHLAKAYLATEHERDSVMNTTNERIMLGQTPPIPATKSDYTLLLEAGLDPFMFEL